MKRITIALSLLFAAPAFAQSPEQQAYAATFKALEDLLPHAAYSCRTVGQWSQPGTCNIAIGLHSGDELLEGDGLTASDAAGNILIGNDTHLPTPDAVGFVNIANIICGWRGDLPGQLTPAKCPEAR